MEYPKINSLWKREGWYFDEKVKKLTPPDLQSKRQSFIIGDYAEPEFGNVRQWRVDEKVDGTNIRIFYTKTMLHGGEIEESVTFGGRTSNAQLPTHLLAHLQKTFTAEWLNQAFPECPCNVILFGEGYGPKIQACGGNYRRDPGFIIFDVVVGGWWLKREAVKEIADKLAIPMVPDLGVMTEDEIVAFVKSKPLSRCSLNPQMMEGVIARSEPLMLFRNGKPLVFKLKCKEFDCADMREAA